MGDTTTLQTAAAVADAPAETKTALEPAKKAEIITTPTQYEAALRKWEGRFNVLTPFAQISGLAAQHGIIASVVRINPDPAKGGPGEVYDGLPFLKAGEVAIAKIGLRKIAECAGISTTTVRTDPRTIPHYWEFKAIATYRGIDGTVVQREATAEWDLRDGSARLKGWTVNQIEEGRKNGLRNAETRAINAAIREFGIKQKYSRRELEKPFLVLRVAFQPDMTDPDQRRLVAEQSLRGTSLLYGGGAPIPTLPPGGEPASAEVLEGAVVDHEPRTVGASAAPATPDPDAPPTEDAVRVVKVERKDGETKGRKWVRFTVVDSRGEECSTFSKDLMAAAEKARDEKAWVELVIETNGTYRNLIEIAPAGSSPKLPLPDPASL